MALYKKTRFDLTNMVDYGTQNPNYPCMNADINAVLAAPGKKSTKWKLAMCRSHNEGSEADHAINQRYPIFVALDDNNNVIGRVAAPCPPFCTNDGYAGLNVDDDNVEDGRYIR